MILSIKMQHINQQDSLLLTVDKLSKVVVREESLKLNDNETLWVKFYDDGFVSYGLTMEKDPQHGNQKYTWSSNADAINTYFKLEGDWKLAIWDVGVREADIYKCYCAAGIRLNYALLLAEYNQDLLNYGYRAFYIHNTGEAFVEVEPTSGLHILHHILELEDENRWFVEAKEGFIDGSKLSDYMLHKTGQWHLKSIYDTLTI